MSRPVILTRDLILLWVRVPVNIALVILHIKRQLQLVFYEAMMIRNGARFTSWHPHPNHNGSLFHPKLQLWYHFRTGLACKVFLWVKLMALWLLGVLRLRLDTYGDTFCDRPHKKGTGLGRRNLRVSRNERSCAQRPTEEFNV